MKTLTLFVLCIGFMVSVSESTIPGNQTSILSPYVYYLKMKLKANLKLCRYGFWKQTLSMFSTFKFNQSVKEVLNDNYLSQGIYDRHTWKMGR